jgi:hypothetical protein
MSTTIPMIIRQVNAIIERDIRDADEYMSARSELKGMIRTAELIRGNTDDDIEILAMELAIDQFNDKHVMFADMMKGVYDTKRVLQAVTRYLTRPGENKPMMITPFVAEVFVADWNSFVGLFDADVQYTDVTPAVRDVLLALTHATREVLYGTTLRMQFSMSDGRFTTMLGEEKIDVLANGRCWVDLVDVKRAKRMKKSARGAGRVLWNLLHHHRAVYENGELILNSDRGDALRRAYSPRDDRTVVRRNLFARARPGAMR